MQPEEVLSTFPHVRPFAGHEERGVKYLNLILFRKTSTNPFRVNDVCLFDNTKHDLVFL